MITMNNRNRRIMHFFNTQSFAAVYSEDYCFNKNYDIIESLPIWECFKFKLHSYFIATIYLLKLCGYFLLSSMGFQRFNNQCFLLRKIQSGGGGGGSGGGGRQQTNHNYDDFYDRSEKPPDCLIDDAIGKHCYVKLQGIKYHYVEAGAHHKRIIILIHGFPDCWLGWRNQIQVLSQYFHVIAIDLKGFGDSDKPSNFHLYSPYQICFELGKFIQSFCGTQPAIIIGHDLGALIGWFFAHTNPEKIEKFIAVSSPHPNELWKHFRLDINGDKNFNWLKFIQVSCLPEKELCQQSNEYLNRNLSHTLQKSSTDDHNNNHHQHHNRLYVYRKLIQKRNLITGGGNNSHSGGGYNNNTIGGGELSISTPSLSSTTSLSSLPTGIGQFHFNKCNIIDAYKYLYTRELDWTGSLNYYRSFPFYRISENELINCPCLIITGSEDKNYKLESLIKSCEYCSNYFVKIIEGAGHWPHQEAADEFNNVILKYLIGREIKPSSDSSLTSTADSLNNRAGLVGRVFNVVTDSVNSIKSYIPKNQNLPSVNYRRGGTNNDDHGSTPNDAAPTTGTATQTRTVLGNKFVT